MGVKLAQDIAHRPGGFFIFGRGLQPQFGHGVDNPALHRLEAIADMGQGPIQDDVHGVFSIGFLGEHRHGHLFDIVRD